MSGVRSNKTFRLWTGFACLALMLAIGLALSSNDVRANAPPVSYNSPSFCKIAPSLHLKSAGTISPFAEPNNPTEPNIVLYDQLNFVDPSNVSSQNFETEFDLYDDQAADDFYISTGDEWTINTVRVQSAYSSGGPANSVTVFFYDTSGSLPGAQVYSAYGLAYSDPGNTGSFTVTLTTPAVLPTGHWWLSVQANMDLDPLGQWFWQSRTVQSNSPSAWQNPSDGFGTGCTSWDTNPNCSEATAPDMVFRLIGYSIPPSPTSIRPTPVPFGCWNRGPDMPTAQARAVGVVVPNLNRFYTMGGRSSDAAGSDIVNPRYYDRNTDTWTVDTAATFDNATSNMACAYLNGPTGPRIYCAGGYPVSGPATSAVREYDPAAHTISTLTADPLARDTLTGTLPGGFAVHNNKLYILGGYNHTAITMTNQIWMFDPLAAEGSKWTHKNAVIPDANAKTTGMGFIPATAIGNFIYGAGGLGLSGSTLVDSVVAFRYDPIADVLSDAAVPDLPSPGTAETRAINFNNKVWVIGGGRTPPNPSADVLQFDPANVGAGWVTVPSPVIGEGRRHMALDINPSNNGTYMAGGYIGSGNTPASDFYLWLPYWPCLSTRTPTGTPTNTPTTTYTPTPTPMLIGHVIWQGPPTQPDIRQQLPITLTLKLDAAEVNYSSQTTDANGFFTVSLGSLPSGTYDWRVKGPKYLANGGTVALEGSNVRTLERSDKNVPAFQRSNVLTTSVEIRDGPDAGGERQRR